MTTYAKFFARSAGTVMTPRGAVFECESASGGEVTNGIGYGKVTVPHYENFRRPAAQQIKLGDICVAWDTAPFDQPLHVAMFLVATRQYRDGGRYEVAGPDFIAELQDYVAIAPVGQAEEIVTTAISLGQRATVPSPGPGDWETLQAAYPPRGYITQDFTPAGDEQILFLTPTTIQETDRFQYTFADGERWEADVIGVSDQRKSIKISPPLSRNLPAGAKVHFYSTRLRVASAAALEANSLLFYTPAVDMDKLPDGNFMIERVEVGTGTDPHYVYSADPITDTILAGSGVTQFRYTAPTTGDVTMLLRTSTFNEWGVLRSPLATIGSAYAPQGESVFETLLAITDITGYQFRRYFRGWAANETIFAPGRLIEYAPPGHPLVAGEVTTLGTTGAMGSTYGEIISLGSEDEHGVVTHLIPYGGGGGSSRFDFRDAQIGLILEDYPEIWWGIVNHHYYIYNRDWAASRAVWYSETFSQISPLDPFSQESREEAAEQLLRAACEWLRDNAFGNAGYVAEIHTTGEPRVGDVVTVNYNGVEPTNITDTLLIITEVHHEVKADLGYRTTRLVLNKTGKRRHTGEYSQARALLDLQRAIRHGNFPSSGAIRLDYNTLVFGQGGDVLSQTGDLNMTSRLGDIYMTSDTGDVNISGTQVNITGALTVGEVRAQGMILEDDTNSAADWFLTVITVRGKPRLKLTRRAKAVP